MIKNNKLFQQLMTLPTIILLATLSVFPIIYTLYYSFTDYYYLSKTKSAFIGIQNYLTILQDDIFRLSVINTLKFMFIAVTLETLLGLFMALFLQNKKKGIAKIYRSLFLLPCLLPPVTVSLIWQMMLSNNRGVINQVLSLVNLPTQNWLQDPSFAMASIITIDVWQWSPFAFLLIYAAIQTVPSSQYEAANIDGASTIAKIRYITLPYIRPTIFMVILLRTIDCFRLFDKVNILTKGGPANTTTTVTQYIFQKGIHNLHVGYGSAVSILMVFMVLLLSSIYIRKALGEKNA